MIGYLKSQRSFKNSHIRYRFDEILRVKNRLIYRLSISNYDEEYKNNNNILIYKEADNLKKHILRTREFECEDNLTIFTRTMTNETWCHYYKVKNKRS